MESVGTRLKDEYSPVAGQCDAQWEGDTVSENPDGIANASDLGVNQTQSDSLSQLALAGTPFERALAKGGAEKSSWSEHPVDSAMDWARSMNLRAPDFVNFQIDSYVFSASGTFTRDGHSFLGYGANMAVPNAMSFGATVQVGWLNRADIKPGDVNQFVAGYSGSGAGLYGGVGGAVLLSPGNGSATVVGFGVGETYKNTPGSPVGIAGARSVDQGRTGISW